MSVPKLTKEQSTILSAYTGYLCGDFVDLHEYTESLMGRSVWTHEFGDERFAKKLQELSKPDFLELLP